jgi:hypothetical protein
LNGKYFALITDKDPASILKELSVNQKIFIVLLLIICPFCYGTIYPTKSYAFEYHFNGEKYPVIVSKASYEDALEEGATRCFNHFAKSKGSEKVSLSDDFATELIDECANPSKKQIEVAQST